MMNSNTVSSCAVLTLSQQCPGPISFILNHIPTHGFFECFHIFDRYGRQNQVIHIHSHYYKDSSSGNHAFVCLTLQPTDCTHPQNERLQPLGVSFKRLSDRFSRRMTGNGTQSLVSRSVGYLKSWLLVFPGLLFIDCFRHRHLANATSGLRNIGVEVTLKSIPVKR